MPKEPVLGTYEYDENPCMDEPGGGNKGGSQTRMEVVLWQ